MALAFNSKTYHVHPIAFGKNSWQTIWPIPSPLPNTRAWQQGQWQPSPRLACDSGAIGEFRIAKTIPRHNLTSHGDLIMNILSAHRTARYVVSCVLPRFTVAGSKNLDCSLRNTPTCLKWSLTPPFGELFLIRSNQSTFIDDSNDNS